MQISLYRNLLLGITLFLLVNFNVYADGPAERKGVATTTFSSSKPSDNELKDAQDKAVNAAWDSYTAEFNTPTSSVATEKNLTSQSREALITIFLVSTDISFVSINSFSILFRGTPPHSATTSS